MCDKTHIIHVEDLVVADLRVLFIGGDNEFVTGLDGNLWGHPISLCERGTSCTTYILAVPHETGTDFRSFLFRERQIRITENWGLVERVPCRVQWQSDGS